MKPGYSNESPIFRNCTFLSVRLNSEKTAMRAKKIETQISKTTSSSFRNNQKIADCFCPCWRFLDGLFLCISLWISCDKIEKWTFAAWLLQSKNVQLRKTINIKGQSNHSAVTLKFNNPYLLITKPKNVSSTSNKHLWKETFSANPCSSSDY